VTINNEFAVLSEGSAGRDQPFLIPRKDRSKPQALRSVNPAKIGGVVAEYPELTKAVRRGDLSTISLLCARLFDWNSKTKMVKRSKVAKINTNVKAGWRDGTPNRPGGRQSQSQVTDRTEQGRKLSSRQDCAQSG
jgi:hypothetical protein